MRFAALIILLIGLTACQTAQGTNSGMSLSNSSGPEFTISGTSTVSPEQLKKEMTFKAAIEADKRGYRVVALVNNSAVTGDQGVHRMTATYRGYDDHAQAGNRQTLDTRSYLQAQGPNGAAPRTKTSKYGGGLFKPTTPQGRAIDAAMAAASAKIFGRYQ